MTDTLHTISSLGAALHVAVSRQAKTIFEMQCSLA